MPAEVVVLGGGVGGTLAANLLDDRSVETYTSPWSTPRACTTTSPAISTSRSAKRRVTGSAGRSGHSCAVAWISRSRRLSAIHPDAGTVQLDRGGNIPWDYLVIATGARLVPDADPGPRRGVVRVLLARRRGTSCAGAAPVPRRTRSRWASPGSRTSARRRPSSSRSWSTGTSGNAVSATGARSSCCPRSTVRSRSRARRS